MRTRIATLLVICATAATASAESSFELPPAYKEQPKVVASQLEALRARTDAVKVEAMAYVSPDGKVYLIRIASALRGGGGTARDKLEAFDRYFTDGMGREAPANLKHVSYARQFSGGQMIVEAVEKLDDKRFAQRRISAVDKDGLVHFHFISCAGPPDELGDCQRSQQTMKLVVPNQVMVSEVDAGPTATPAAPSTTSPSPASPSPASPSTTSPSPNPASPTPTKPMSATATPTMPAPPAGSAAAEPNATPKPTEATAGAPASSKASSPTSPSESHRTRTIIGASALIALVVGLVAWIIQSAARGSRRRRRRR